LLDRFYQRFQPSDARFCPQEKANERGKDNDGLEYVTNQGANLNGGE